MPVNYQCDKCSYKSMTAVKLAGSIINCPACHGEVRLKCPVCNVDVIKNLTTVKHIGSTVQCPACHEAVHVKCPCCNGDIIVPNAITLITPAANSLDRKRKTLKLSDSNIISVPNGNESGIQIKRPDPLSSEELKNQHDSSRPGLSDEDNLYCFAFFGLHVMVSLPKNGGAKMGRKMEFNAKQCGEITVALKSAKSKEEYQRALCLCLRVEEGLGGRRIAQMLGMSFGGVRNIHSRYLKHGEGILTNVSIGGRLHANMSLEEEKDFLAPFEKASADSGILVVSDIHKAYERRVGYKVPASTVYRLLARQGWRKVAPRPSHPKTDVNAQEAFKKTSQENYMNSKRWIKNR